MATYVILLIFTEGLFIPLQYCLTSLICTTISHPWSLTGEFSVLSGSGWFVQHTLVLVLWRWNTCSGGWVTEVLPGTSFLWMGHDDLSLLVYH